MLRTLLFFVTLPLLYLGVNPDWYGDALWYATEVQSKDPIVPEAFHLLWNPTARFLSNLLFSGGNALVVLQLMSGVGAALTLFGTERIARHFLPPREIPWVIGLVASTHFLVAYGGSGASYSVALGATMMAYSSLLNSASRWREVEGSAWMVVALSAWGVAVLGMIAFLVASYVGDKTRVGADRLVRAVAISIVPCATFGIMLLLAHSLFVPKGSENSFLSWVLAASGHGVASGLSVVSFAKAALGFVACTLHLDGLGTSLKQVMRGELSHSALLELAPHIVAFVWWGILVLISVSRMRATRENSPLIALSVASLTPVGLFAVGWHGSDVERWCLSVPFIILLMWGGARRLNGNVGALVCYALPLTLLVVNVFGLLVATHLNGGSLDRKVAEAIRTEVPEGSLVLVTGQTLGARGGHIATYFYRLRFHSVSFDVLMRGEDKWKGRLAEVINLTTSAHLPVVVLSDLLGEPSPSGIGLSPSEFPRPTVDETREAITNLVVEQRRMRVGSFQFVVMRAP